jgi:hypothetical protein
MADGSTEEIRHPLLVVSKVELDELPIHQDGEADVTAVGAHSFWPDAVHLVKIRLSHLFAWRQITGGAHLHDDTGFLINPDQRMGRSGSSSTTTFVIWSRSSVMFRRASSGTTKASNIELTALAPFPAIPEKGSAPAAARAGGDRSVWPDAFDHDKGLGVGSSAMATTAAG